MRDGKLRWAAIVLAVAGLLLAFLFSGNGGRRSFLSFLI